MTSYAFSTRRARAVLTATVLLAAAPSLGQAQGTDEQREACTPDAVKLCSDTIPDIPKTTACMQAHFRQLSPRCKVAFSDAAGPKTGAPAVATEPAAPGLPPQAEAPVTARAPVPGSVAAYRASIARDCAEGLIDAYTCRSTMQVLEGIE